MAAIRGACKLCQCPGKPYRSCPQFSYVYQILHSRHHASASSKSTSHKPDDVLPKKKRDRLTVLRALASTVEMTPNRPDYRFFDDLILNPRSLIKQKELLLAIESGEKAADYVMETYPDLFPLRQPVPAWPDHSPSLIEDTAENLLLLMKLKENSAKVISLYEKLKSEEDLSIDIHNAMLDYVSFHSIPNQSSQPTESSEKNDTESSSSSSSSSSEDEEMKNKDELINKNETTWIVDGYADNLFRDLKHENNSRTYEVYMLGLLKHGEYIQAFHLLEEFQEKKLEGSVFLYNTFLRHVCDLREGDENRWNMVQQIVSCMKKDSLQPNVVTFTEILAVAFTMEKNAQTLCHKIIREMNEQKIVPSLGCYYYVLLAERKKDYQDISVLWEIVNSLKKGNINFTLQHPSDVMFFHSAMDLARFKRNGVIAKDVLNLVLDNGIRHMLGTKSSSFFGNYLCAIARNAPTLEEVFYEYEKIVPKYVIPRDWVFQQLLLACRNHRNPEHVPRLYADMVSMRVPLTERAANALFQAMNENVPKERCEEFLNVAKDSSKWMTVFNVKMTSDISSTIVKLLCLCEKLEEARDMVEEMEKQQLIPSNAAMYTLVKLSMLQENKQVALNLLKKMSEMKIAISAELENEIMESTLLSDQHLKIMSWFK